MDIFTLKGLTDEFNLLLKKPLINKIYHHENELFIRLYSSSKKNLYINISPSNQVIFLTEKKFLSFQQNPTGFCMILRKYLQGRKIENFSLYDFYRILQIEIDSYYLIIKFTGRSSDIILTDKEYQVVYSLKDKNKIKEFKISPTKIINNLEEFKNSKNIEGLPPFALKEINFIKDKYGYEEAFNYYKKLINFRIDLKPYKIKDKIYPFKLEHLKEEGIFLDSFNEIFEFKPDIKVELLKKLQDKIKRIKKTLDKINEEIKEKKEYRIFFRFGELLKSNLHLLKQGMESIKVFDYEENNHVTIKLDKNISPVENMEKYFEKAKKFKRAIKKLEERKNIIESELNYLLDLLFFVEESKNIDEIKMIYQEFFNSKKNQKVETVSKPYKEIIFNNTKIIIGTSAKGNDYIIRNFGKPDYVWCHARGVPGAHVIILENFDKVPKKTLEYACELALKHSKAKNNLKGDVIFTKIKYLKKPKNAFPGQVLVTKENVIFIKLENEN